MLAILKQHEATPRDYGHGVVSGERHVGGSTVAGDANVSVRTFDEGLEDDGATLGKHVAQMIGGRGYGARQQEKRGDA